MLKDGKKKKALNKDGWATFKICRVCSFQSTVKHSGCPTGCMGEIEGSALGCVSEWEGLLEAFGNLCARAGEGGHM